MIDIGSGTGQTGLEAKSGQDWDCGDLMVQSTSLNHANKSIM
jgi:hypothetical protein